MHLAAAAPAMLLSVLPLIAGGLNAQGAVENHTFNSGFALDGVKSLADLRGRPVLIEFWGQN